MFRQYFGNLSADDLLRRIGLERRPTTLDRLLAALGLFASGAIVGAALGLLFAPKTGEELRAAIRTQAKRWREPTPSGPVEPRRRADGPAESISSAAHS